MHVKIFPALMLRLLLSGLVTFLAELAGVTETLVVLSAATTPQILWYSLYACINGQKQEPVPVALGSSDAAFPPPALFLFDEA